MAKEEATDFIAWGEFEEYWTGLGTTEILKEVQDDEWKFGSQGSAIMKDGGERNDQVKSLYKLHLAQVVKDGSMKQSEADELLNEIGLNGEAKKTTEKKTTEKKPEAKKIEAKKIEAKKKSITIKKSRMDLYKETGSPFRAESKVDIVFQMIKKNADGITMNSLTKNLSKKHPEISAGYIKNVVDSLFTMNIRDQVPICVKKEGDKLILKKAKVQAS